MTAASQPLRRLTCSVCGSDAGRFQQWSNRDTGYGICAPCVDWLKGRGTSAEELQRNYGTAGVHYLSKGNQGPQP